MLGVGTFNTQSGANCTTTVVAASTTGGTKVRVTDAHLFSSLTQTSLQLRTNGVTGPIYIVVSIDGETKSGSEVFSEGILFPNGVYLVTAANFGGCSINYRTEL